MSSVSNSSPIINGYTRASLATILSLIAFILLFITVRISLDRVLYCGTLGVIFLGVVYESLFGHVLLHS